MTILDQKRKQKEAQREAERVAREQEGTNIGTVTGMTNLEHHASTASPVVRPSVVSPANTAQAVYGDPKKLSINQKPVKEEQATPVNAIKSPQATQPQATPPAAAPKKKSRWFFWCCGGSRE